MRASRDLPWGSVRLFKKRKNSSFKWAAWHGGHLHLSTGKQLSLALPYKEVLEAPMAVLLEMNCGAERAGCLQSPESGAVE